MMQKWNFVERVYKPYQVPGDWRCPLMAELDAKVNCANCGKEVVYGDTLTSRTIHNHIGLGFPVCESCYSQEREEELASK